MSFSTEQFLHGTPKVTNFLNLLLLFLMSFLARTIGYTAYKLSENMQPYRQTERRAGKDGSVPICMLI